VLALAGVQDPGNLGTIIRSAEAFEAGGILAGENTVNLLNWKVLRASAGSLFRLPTARTSISEAIAKLRTGGVRLVATSSHKGTPIHEINWTQRAAVFIGNEGAGLPHDVLAKMDEVMAIPHSSKVESLNAGIAASIVLYEAAKQRNQAARAEASKHSE
jgi:TrmH family RNA methyltransferase